MAVVFTEEEKTLIRHHLGYPNTATKSTYLVGLPVWLEHNFIIEGSLQVVLEAAAPLARRLLHRLECLEAQLYENAGDFAATKRVGDLELSDQRVDTILKLYKNAQMELANLFATRPNPQDQRTDLRSTPINMAVRSV